MVVKTLSFGAVVWDIIHREEHIGGAPFNLVAHMAKLGCNSAIVTRVGKDARGNAAIDEMKKLGIDTSFVQKDPKHRTGTAEVVITGLGLPTYKIPEDAAYDYIEINEYILNAIKAFKPDVICFGTLEQRNKVTRESLYKLLDNVSAKHIFFDVNIRFGFYPEHIIKKSMSYSSIIKFNESEVGLISELLYKELLSEKNFVNKITEDYAIQTLCITKGKDGCIIYHEGKSKSYPEYVVEVIDTIGAGDAFSAAFLNNYCKTNDAFESARLGNIMGAYVASQKGAIPEYTEEIMKIMFPINSR